jgi:uncharacterized protein YjbI with pentapeptide repeats
MRSRLAPPRAPSMRLEDLAAGFLGDLSPGGSAEALTFTDIDLTGISLSGATVSECDLDGVRGPEADLRGARLLESRIRSIDVPVFRAPRSTWRDVMVDGGRLGSAELYETSWTAVRITGCKLGFVNLRGATLTDVVFEDCVIDELDLGGARVKRAAFPGSAIRLLDLQKAQLADVDLRRTDLQEIAGIEGLRGATVDSDQLTLLAPLLARSMGVNVED